MTDHPITLPPELIDEWRRAPEYTDGLGKLTMVTVTVDRLQYIAAQAARWGSDQELEACCEWLHSKGSPNAFRLRTARRPKPPSLKEQALQILDVTQKGWGLAEVDLDTIRRALNELPND